MNALSHATSRDLPSSSLEWHFWKLQHISNFSSMLSHSHDSTQPSLLKRYNFCFLRFIQSFWHILRNGKIPHCLLPWFKPSPTNFFTSSQIWHCTLYPHKTISTIIMPKHHHSKPHSPTNVIAFPTEDWMTKDCSMECVVLAQIGEVIGYEDYYFENERGIIHARLFHVGSCHHNQQQCILSKQHQTRRQHWSQLQDAEGPSPCARSTSRLLGLPPNWISLP